MDILIILLFSIVMQEIHCKNNKNDSLYTILLLVCEKKDCSVSNWYINMRIDIELKLF